MIETRKLFFDFTSHLWIILNTDTHKFEIQVRVEFFISQKRKVPSTDALIDLSYSDFWEILTAQYFVRVKFGGQSFHR